MNSYRNGNTLQCGRECTVQVHSTQCRRFVLSFQTTANCTLPLHRNPGVNFEDWVISQLETFIEKAEMVRDKRKYVVT